MKDEAGLGAVIRCAECGAEMRQTRRGATLKKRGPCFVCPQAEAEVSRDERGHLKRAEDGRHAYTRAWEEWELALIGDE